MELAAVQTPHYENPDLALWPLSECRQWELSNAAFPHSLLHPHTRTPITCHLCTYTPVSLYTSPDSLYTSLNTCIPTRMYTYPLDPYAPAGMSFCTPACPLACTAVRLCTCTPVTPHTFPPVYVPEVHQCARVPWEPAHLFTCVPAPPQPLTYLRAC